MSQVIRIDKDRALELLNAVVAGNEDRVYEKPPAFSGDTYASCLYAHGDECGCLIGHALHRAGATLEQLAALDNDPDCDVATVNDIRPPWLDLSDEARRIFGAAQAEQDRGTTWGNALAYALEEAGKP